MSIGQNLHPNTRVVLNGDKDLRTAVTGKQRHITYQVACYPAQQPVQQSKNPGRKEQYPHPLLLLQSFSYAC